MAKHTPPLAKPQAEPPPEPWYKDGLHFTCTQCGKCCTGEPGYVWVNDEEIAALAKSRGERIADFTAFYTYSTRGRRSLREKANGDCIFWEADRGCTVYALRPRQCRTWPFWDSNLKSPEAWAETEAICPGSGEGDFVPLAEITRRAKIIKM